MYKQFADILLASILLFILSPFLLIISIIIWIESGGPVALKLQKPGKDGKKILIYRFRTSAIDEDDDIFILSNEKTRFGRILCRYHIDVMPQLYNVIKGEMPLF